MNPRLQIPIWRQVAEVVLDHENGMTRAEVASKFKVTKSTAKSHLEKGVERWLLFKVYTWTGKNSRGWVYYHMNHRPNGMSIEEEIEWENSLRS